MRIVLAAVAILLLLAVPARAQEMSSNVEPVASLPEAKSAIAINFVDDAMFVSTATGVYSYDVSDPANPTPLGALPMYIWENEDMDVDVKRKRLFISRDPRGFTTPATPGAAFPVGAVHVIDVSNPSLMKQVGFFTLPAGHTSTCVNACDFLWTGGPYANEQAQPDFAGRPIYATDVRDPANPKPCPEPIDTGRNDGVTDYVHDVQVDSRGVAWVSGAGGVRGYWTSGEHRNPVTGRTETATACDPVPYAGSGTPEEATPSRFMHNSFRDPGPARSASAPQAGGPAAAGQTVPAAPAAAAEGVAQSRAVTKPARARCAATKKTARKKTRRAKSRKGAKSRGTATARAAGKRKPRKRKAARRVTCAKAKKRPRRVSKVTVRSASVAAASRDEGPKASRIADERILYATEENLDDDCAKSGRFVAYDLTGTFGGEGFRDVATAKHRMKVLDTWTPEAQEGATGCASAHYFASRGDGLFANAFYEQGVRFLDVSNPQNIRQVGWWRPDDANTFATYFRDGHVFVADFTRGVEILKFDGRPSAAKQVKAPALGRAVTRRMDPELGFLCPLEAPV
jgi:hypothetical protein